MNLRKVSTMNRPMSKVESFAQRRMLFKEVWASAVDSDDNKYRRPRVVKALNLDDIERSTGKRKKQKIRNLKTACHKLLEYCDHQEPNYSPARSPEPKNQEQSGATYSGDDNAKLKRKKRSKSTSLKLPKS